MTNRMSRHSAEGKMKQMLMNMPGRTRRLALTIALLALLAGAPAKSEAAQQELFAAPEQAGQALRDASGQDGGAALLAILGPDAKDLVSSGDPVADKNGRKKFTAAYDARHGWESDGDRKILVVGRDQWPMPIPLVRAEGKWRFDTKAGRQEILERRIGRNELNVIETCRAYVEAQEDYAREFSGSHEYAQRFRSTPGKHDGLYWQTAQDEPESPLGYLMAEAESEGYTHAAKKGQRTPYHGYYYRILKEQSAAAPGGARNYVVKGRMTGGFALLAWPAKYGVSGIRSFIVNQTGIVYEKDLGPKTAAIAGALKKYAPDKTWQASPEHRQAAAD